MSRSENFNHRDDDRSTPDNQARSASERAFEDVRELWSSSKKLLPDRKSLSDGLTGVGQGLVQSVKETADLTALRDGLLQAADAVTTLGKYAAQKITTGDLKGFVRDAQAVGANVEDLANEFTHLPPKEQGRIIGHDILPLIIPSDFAPAKDGKVLKGAAELLTKAADHNLPTHEMLDTLDGSFERLHPMEKEFLNRHDIKVTGIARAIDTGLPGVGERTLGYFSRAQKTIGIAQEINLGQKWMPNEHIEFTLKHEMGHAFNQLNDYKDTGKFISDRPTFVKAFNRDTDKIADIDLHSLGLLRPTEKEARDEVFADLYAHASGGVTTDGATNKILRCFPRCFEYVRGFNDVK